jgi:hypothetical protein
MRDIDEIFGALARSDFRAKFKLRGRELAMLHDKRIDAIMDHARKLIDERLAPADIPNDGKQTPWRNHPVFVAQHATATCCRGCLEKWHRISRGRQLDEHETAHVLAVIRRWLDHQASGVATSDFGELSRAVATVNDKQLSLFKDPT